MAFFNKVVLVGNVTRNPDIRNIPDSATMVATTGLATNRKFKDKEEVMFIDIVAFGKSAEIMGQYVTKGTPLLVEGRLSFRQWEQDGQKRSKHEIIVDSFQMLGGRRETSEDYDSSKVNKDELQMPSDDAMVKDEDIPF